MLKVPETVSPQPLAIFRIIVGLVATAKGIEFSVKALFYTPPKPLYSFLPVLPTAIWAILAILMIAASILVVLGLWTRFAAVVTGLLLLAYIWGAYYSNHTYLLATLVLMLALADSDAAISLRSWQGLGRERVWAPPVYLLRAQISIVYVYAAANKLNFDFLSGNTLASLGFTSMVVPHSFRIMPLLVAMAVGAIATELFVGITLWVHRLRPFAVTLGVLLHLSMVIYISPNLVAAADLTFFAAMMIAGYTLFVDRIPHSTVCPVSGIWRRTNAASFGSNAT